MYPIQGISRHKPGRYDIGNTYAKNVTALEFVEEGQWSVLLGDWTVAAGVQ